MSLLQKKKSDLWKPSDVRKEVRTYELKSESTLGRHLSVVNSDVSGDMMVKGHDYLKAEVPLPPRFDMVFENGLRSEEVAEKRGLLAEIKEIHPYAALDINAAVMVSTYMGMNANPVTTPVDEMRSNPFYNHS